MSLARSDLTVKVRCKNGYITRSTGGPVLPPNHRGIRRIAVAGKIPNLVVGHGIPAATPGIEICDSRRHPPIFRSILCIGQRKIRTKTRPIPIRSCRGRRGSPCGIFHRIAGSAIALMNKRHGINGPIVIRVILKGIAYSNIIWKSICKGGRGARDA